ncbi:MAG: hypothetical protein GOU97_02535 [Nanoarchaeota archaeon]|nr:hypothetical protein [Nanoarchaeota archaeon]
MRLVFARLEQGSYLPERFDLRKYPGSEEYAKRLFDFRNRLVNNFPYTTHNRPKIEFQKIEGERDKIRVEDRASFTFFDCKVESVLEAEMFYTNPSLFSAQKLLIKLFNEMIFSNPNFSVEGIRYFTASNLEPEEILQARHEITLLGQEHTVLGTVSNEIRDYSKEFGVGFKIIEKEKIKSKIDKSDLVKVLMADEPAIEIKQAIIQKNYDHLITF